MASTRRLNRIESLLVDRGVISVSALDAAKDRQRGAKKPLVEILLEQEAVDEDLLVEVLAEATGSTVMDHADLKPDPAVQNLIDPETAQRLGVLPLHIDGDTLVVATVDPMQVLAFDELEHRTGRTVCARFARPSAVRAAMREARHGEEALHDLVKNSVERDVIVERDETRELSKGALELRDPSEDAPTIQLVNLILSDAITRKASDVHIEAEKDYVRVRFRLDGVLSDILTLPSSACAPVVSRIKIIGGLDIIETRHPQDGRAKVTVDDHSYDLRISTIPSYFGEKVVLRILDPSAASFSLDRAGLEASVLDQWRDLITRPNGLLLMTGPTGSGKTSTLYASILEIRKPSLNIVAVEDPVEYQFPGIVHVPVRADIGMTFAAALRSILRQDPDVLLLGEIRDAETAQTAIQAAMTGHLVLSTLHTNDAFGAIPRLLDLGVDRGQLASCLLGVMAQRLVRTVCENCAGLYQCDPAQLRLIGWEGEEAETRRGDGCHQCRGSGFHGRSAIAELIRFTPALAKLMQDDASDQQLRAQIRKDGTRTLLESGLRKVIEGETMPEEVLKVAAREVEAQAQASTPAPAPRAPAACPACGGECQTRWRLCPMCGTELPRDGDGPSVIVCDDERVARRQVIAALRKEFPVVHEAETGEMALDLVARHDPDLLVVDMMMPGMNGMEVILSLRCALRTAALPIIMLTASQDDLLEAESLEAGADDYVQKPVIPERLRARVRALLRSRTRRD